MHRARKHRSLSRVTWPVLPLYGRLCRCDSDCGTSVARSDGLVPNSIVLAASTTFEHDEHICDTVKDICCLDLRLHRISNKLVSEKPKGIQLEFCREVLPGRRALKLIGQRAHLRSLVLYALPEKRQDFFPPLRDLVFRRFALTLWRAF